MILRLILEALVAVLMISLLRSVIGVLGKAFFRQSTGPGSHGLRSVRLFPPAGN